MIQKIREEEAQVLVAVAERKKFDRTVLTLPVIVSIPDSVCQRVQEVGDIICSLSGIQAVPAI